jgi:hypothetical protein
MRRVVKVLTTQVCRDRRRGDSGGKLGPGRATVSAQACDGVTIGLGTFRTRLFSLLPLVVRLLCSFFTK